MHIAPGDFVGRKKIIFASSISNNRFCIYLSAKNIMDNLISNHPDIVINNVKIEARILINPDKRIIISNVSPSIPHSIIELALLELGLNLVSSVTFLRAGMQNQEYSQLLGFWRQVFVWLRETKTVTKSITISYEGTNYRIFLSQDNLTCHLCKK